MTEQVYDASFFDGQSERSLESAQVVLGMLFPLIAPRRVLDVGCGVGTWLRAALDLGVEEVIGTDGDYVDPAALLIDRSSFLPADLARQSIPDVLGSRPHQFDLVICMEVAEHLPHARGPSLVAELTSLGDLVLFSAAIPFQYGTNHINEQWPEYWSMLFRGQGFDCFDPFRAQLWNHPGVEWWYAQNALLFARQGTRAAAALPAESRVGRRGLSLVHPNNLLSNLLGLPRRYRQHASQEEVRDLQTVVEANRRGDARPPPLIAPARAAGAEPNARDVFPWTRSEVYQPEQEIAAGAKEATELSRRLGETGYWLRAANQAFALEREARFAIEAQARDAHHWRDQSQAHAAARLKTEMMLVDLQEDELRHRQALENERSALLAELDDQRRALDAEVTHLKGEVQAALQRGTAELGQRNAELDAQASQIEAVRRSRVWKTARRVQAVGGRVVTRLRPSTVPSSIVEAALPVEELVLQSEAGLSELDASVSEITVEAEAPPDKPQIKSFGQVLGEVNWWTLAGAITRLKRLEVFDAEDYLRRNGDVAAAGIDPYAHFIQSGALEGRGRVDPEDLARVMSGLALFDHAVRTLTPETNDDSDLANLVGDVNHIGIFVSTHGNVFMQELADDLAAELHSVGARVDVLDETTDIAARPPTCLFVAPHEFFVLGRGPEWVRDDVLSEGFMFGTEQVQTTWFNLSLPFILMSRGVLDLCTQTTDLFKRLDMAALHVLPGARFRPHLLTDRDRLHPLYGVLPQAARGDIDPSLAFAARPIDISFFGTSSQRRDQFFTRNAAFFAEYETFNYNRRPGRGPIRGEGDDGALTRLAGHVSGHSKITLNIHREEFGYFEWHRMVRLGMCSGSLVVSDPCLPHPDFVANEHYLQENARHIPDLLEWLLKTEEGAREAERVRANVDALISNSFGTTHMAARMLRFFAQHRSHERG